MKKTKMSSKDLTIQQSQHISTFDSFAVKVESVSKKYCKSLKRSMLYGVEDIARNTLGLSSHSDKLRKNEFWAVDDVSFEVKKGETLGIIGSNGSGKTTMLKMLNGIFWPDKGKITIKGKVGALIEVGAGFHPLLTGRENVYINAAILGMTKEETDKKFNDIVDFADIGDFLDVPVKHYSSGMFVRLGFSVAIHCKPDILLVDEVLAVGDLRFSLKCHRKMSEYRQNGGTVVIVSHNMQAIRNICKNVLWLNNGKIKEIGEVHNVCNLYEENIIKNGKSSNFIKGKQYRYDSEVNISKIEFLNNQEQKCANFKVGDYFKLRIYFNCKRIVKNAIFTVSLFNIEGLLVSSNYSNFDGYNIEKISGEGHVDFCINKLVFKPSKYICSITFSEKEVSNVLEWHEKSYTFNIKSGITNNALINPFPKWFFKT
jgi:lipopolysaccharide transport system ATP-binding protein